MVSRQGTANHPYLPSLEAPSLREFGLDIPGTGPIAKGIEAASVRVRCVGDVPFAHKEWARKGKVAEVKLAEGHERVEDGIVPLFRFGQPTPSH